jgi:hypothetical protein
MFSCAALGVALSASGARADPPQNSVTGGGQQAIGGPNFFSLSAHSDANGANPNGSFSFSGGPPGSQPWHVNVTCLLMLSSNDAVATGVVDRPATAAGQLVVAEAVDNGDPQNGQPVDLLRFSFASNGGIFQISPDCYFPVFGPVPIQEGNIVVHQAAP